MRTMILAAAAALSLGVGSAYAGEGGFEANSWFTELQAAQAQVQSAQPTATAQNGQATHIYAAASSRGTYLFQPSQNGGANS